LILTGLLLLVLEFFVFPGVTIAGIGGALMIAAGLILAYTSYGAPTGHFVLALTLVALFGVIGMALRGKTWNRLKLDTEISAKVETVPVNLIHPGDRGITISRLNPVGKARINEQEVEAHCPGNFLEPRTEIEIVKVLDTHVIVKPIKQM